MSSTVFPLMRVVIILLGIGVGIAAICLIWLWVRRGDRNPKDNAMPARPEDQQMIVEMLREGKVSGEEAAELLKALGTQRAPADKLPMAASIRGAVGGAILIVVGFMLPWSHVRIRMPFGGGIEGYQAGYNLGFLGWLILILGVLPAILACIPALERHMRLGLLRMVIACIGGAFILTMLIRSPKGIGLWIVAVGFAFQLVTAFAQSGFARPHAQG